MVGEGEGAERHGVGGGEQRIEVDAHRPLARLRVEGGARRELEPHSVLLDDEVGRGETSPALLAEPRQLDQGARLENRDALTNLGVRLHFRLARGLLRGGAARARRE